MFNSMYINFKWSDCKYGLSEGPPLYACHVNNTMTRSQHTDKHALDLFLLRRDIQSL